MKKIDMDIQNVSDTVAACCVLHNMSEIHRDTFNENWLEENDIDLQQPDEV